MILLEMFFSFFKVGLFTIGGGLAMLPLLQQEAIGYGWVTSEQFADMIAISQSTPGPIGINMATFVGFRTAGVMGSLVATAGMVMPSLIIIVIIAKFFLHFNQKPIVKSAFYGLRPAVTGLIATAAFSIATVTLVTIDGTVTNGIVFNYKEIILCVTLLFAVFKWNKHPVVYIGSAAVIGMLIL